VHRKFVFGQGSAPDPTGGAYSAPPDLLAGLRGSTSKGEGERGKEEKMGTGKEGVGPAPLSQIPGSVPVRLTRSPTFYYVFAFISKRGKLDFKFLSCCTHFRAKEHWLRLFIDVHVVAACVKVLNGVNFHIAVNF